MERIIPVLLIKNKELVKTTGFKKPRYVGDTLNTLRIFNAKEVDELILLDIIATTPNIQYLSSLAGECFMPLVYGGGIKSIDDASKVFDCGVEKVSLNRGAFYNPSLITQIANKYGSQSVVVSIDAARIKTGGYSVRLENGTQDTQMPPDEYAYMVQEKGAGEILLTSTERDGTGLGYDVELIKSVSAAVKIPVIACGGAKGMNDFALALAKGASAVAAGSMFCFTGKHRAVLISYPGKKERFFHLAR